VEVANVLAVAEATSDDGPPYRINEGRWLIHDPEGTYKPPKDNQGYDFCAPQGETANAMGPVVVAGDKDKIRTMPLEEGDFVGEVDPARINVLVAFSNFGSPEEVEAQYQNISAVLEKAFNFLPVNFSGLLKEVPVGAGTRNLYGERWVYAPHLEEAGELMKRVGRYDAMVVVVNSGEDKTTEGRPAGAAFLGDFLVQPILSRSIDEWLPVSQAPEWYKDVLESIVVPNWKIFAYLVTYCEFAIGICFIIGFFVRPTALLGIFLTANLFYQTGPFVGDLHRLFLAIFMMMWWVGAGNGGN
jgi:uncharacterized membrane protein YphA (DoxX/SURF4 family)